MADQTTSGDALWKWIAGGLAAGAAILGLMVGAYAIGYDRGQDDPNTAAAVETAPVATTPTEPAQTETTPPATETQPAETQPTGGATSEAALLARGEELWSSTGCSGCHSVDGSAGVGPTMKGLAGSTVTLDDGSTVTADDSYLAKSITDPDAQISE
ncbi:MAG TPA: c-type cytochrome, partial [Gaiella sp.]|nr:c-type cytochrome [Gaiella sp.]